VTRDQPASVVVAVISGVADCVSGDVGATDSSVLVSPTVMEVGMVGSDLFDPLGSSFSATDIAPIATIVLPPTTAARSFTRVACLFEFTSDHSVSVVGP
jgi:hypothetical protein